MKTYRSLLWLTVIAFAMMANNVLPSNISASSSLSVQLVKTPAKKPVVTKTPTKKKISIKAIIKQVSFYGTGGDDYLRDDGSICFSGGSISGSGSGGPISGGGFISSEGTPTPIEPTPIASTPIVPTPIEPRLLSSQIEVKQTESIRFFSCLWDKDKEVSANILKSDNTIQTETINPTSDGNVELIYSTTAFDPVGKYKVIFSNGEQSLEVEFKVKRITEPGTTVLAHEIQVFNFRPYENITVLQYEQVITWDWDSSSDSGPVFDAILKGWQELKTGGDGSLRISNIDFKYAYVVIGERTGQFFVNWIGVSELEITNTDTPTVSKTPLCPGASASRVAIGSTTVVTTRTRIRAQAALSASVITVVPKNDLFIILDGYKCSDGYTWWYGLIGDGIKGWMAESQNGAYLLEPIR